ncbi:hypothetical protein D3C77_237490 [compost metagenome]
MHMAGDIQHQHDGTGGWVALDFDARRDAAEVMRFVLPFPDDCFVSSLVTIGDLQCFEI